MKKAFTLIEILLCISIITLIAGISFPIYLSFQQKNDLDTATNTVVQSLRRAQILAQSAEGDSNWGVRIDNGNIIIFKGENYDIRDQSFDEFSQFPNTINPTGIIEIIFAKMTGFPQASGTLQLSSPGINENKVITINTKGVLNY